MKKYIPMIAVCALMLLPGSALASTYAQYEPYQNYSQTYTYTTPNYTYQQPVYNSAQIASLVRQLAALQAELARLTARGNSYTQCYGSDCYNNTHNTGSVRHIDVVYKNSAAYITIDYTNGRNDDFIAGVDTNEDVIDFLVSTSNLSRSDIVSSISFSNRGSSNHSNNDDEDIRDIKVTIDSNDEEAEARVRFDNGDTERFTYDTDVKSEIVSELSDDLDISESDVRDLVDYSYSNSSNGNNDDIQDIDVYFEDSDDVRVVVRFENNTTKNYSYRNEDDEDEIISMLADDLDVSESDIEDVIDFH